MSGPMCGMDTVVEWAEGVLRSSDTDSSEQILRTLRYMKSRAEGIQPKHHKGIQGPTYDYETCGKCGRAVQIYHNYCPSCGFYLKWPNPRCLVPYSEERPWDDQDYESFFRKNLEEMLKDGNYPDENIRIATACAEAFRYRRIKQQDEKLSKEQREARTKRLVNKIERDEENETKKTYTSDEVIKLVRKCREF